MAEASKLRFNCYLIREDITSLQEAFRVQYRTSGRSPMQELTSTEGAPEGCKAFFSSKTDGEPPWARSLSQTFPQLENVRSLSHRLVIFLPVSGRTFAVCFGYGSSTLEWSHVEANFGLRFASRAYNTLALNEIRSRRIDPSARTQSVQIPNRTSLRDFDMELEGEFVRRVVGELDEGVEDSELGAVVATDSVAFKVETDLHQVQRILARMLETVSQNEVREDLRFIDSLEPLRSKDELTHELEKLLTQHLFGERAAKQSTPGDEDVANLDPYLLSFAPPDDLTIENVHEIRVKCGDEMGYMQEMRIESLLDAISSFKKYFGRSALKDIKVMAVDSDGNPASNETPLKNWLIFEAGSEEKRYLLTLGKWFALAESYARQLDADLSDIEDVTDRLNLGDWDIEKYKEKDEANDNKYGEGAFNADASRGRDDLVCLDTNTMSSLGSQIEACDLFHADGYLIHVKKYTDSQTLSHLFSQGYVAAQTLTEDQDYRRDFIDKVRDLKPDLASAAEEAPTKVTYAIAVERDRTIPSSLPTFSKVNLRGFVHKLRRMKVQPSLARIQMR
ncbi:TIGR04141 family sporadically distributed protein [Streptomyces sp. AJ-1]|uniref:DUF6119 family protein n=1 Tax=Streptomyces sp. AJ-1 TaxID=3044384 RepID=UPI002499DCEC|nr:DUF6119 family protein [Streptomyces sp. AJ-1]MDI3344369.1 TIGR04141 family sporadically distributed protein [Streptomyces sp. AJ-1]